jgi:hypothetical protein
VLLLERALDEKNRCRIFTNIHNAVYTLNTRVSRVSCKFYLKAKGTAFEAPAADVPGLEQRTGSAHSRRQVTTHQRFQLGNIGKLPLDH